ncbi:hypothetical protein BT93_K1807 [Corymbia citriodora subsp. variegata]|nr:hypothetical protein BT93_K1807 [Corymbia citriodora subsp. variegata]
MNTTVKNTTFRLSPANFLQSSPAISRGYKLLNRDSEATGNESDDRWSRITRDERARHRRVFLRTYKLASTDSFGKMRKRRIIRCKKLRKIVLKARRLVVAIISFARARSCDCGSAINASCPRPITRCF